MRPRIQIHLIFLGHVWFEGDCMELVNLINQGEDHRDVSYLLFDLRYIESKCIVSHFSFAISI